MSSQKPAVGGLFCDCQGRLSDRQTAWLGREESNLEIANWKSDAFACPREDAEPLSVMVHK
jgi:hypothetical protein